jgi:predicted O-methyltransferase YrrM
MYFNLISEEIEQYCTFHTQKEEELLSELEKGAREELKYPQMLSGHLQGLFLKQISWMMRPKKILEIGTFAGYSTLCLADGLAEEGVIITIDRNPEAAKLAKAFFSKSEKAAQIECIQADAHQWLKENPQKEVDLVFLDADKAGTLSYYEQLVPMIRKGGFLLVDNVLWNAKVTDPIKESDKETITLDAFNKVITEDERMENLLLPFRDGIMIARKCS